MTGMDSIMGVPVVQSHFATRATTPGEDARRMVRHGMADILAWLGEPVGPAPGERVPAAYVVANPRVLITHPAIAHRLRAELGAVTA